jgi:hypothetical protein
MALLYHAELHPSKLELIAGWAPTQPWFVGDPGADLSNVAAYRFDDPDGVVGIEVILVRAGDGPLLQVPLTYRDTPLAGAEAWLIRTVDHSVLGTRWVYDATGDPAFIAAAATAALTGGSQVEQYFEQDGVREVREPTARVTGDGSGAGVAASEVLNVATHYENGVTVVDSGSLRMTVARVIPSPKSGDAIASLIGTWTDHPEPTTLAEVIRR